MQIKEELSVAAITALRMETRAVFKKHGIEPNSCKSLNELLQGEKLHDLINDLKSQIARSEKNCFSGG